MIRSVTLHHFRNFPRLNLTFDQQHGVITGNNGQGKSNILEALSLFSIGRGMKKAPACELEHLQTQQTGWSVSMDLDTGIMMQTGYQKQQDLSFKRFHKIQHQPVSSANEFSKWLSFLWMTSETDRLFRDTPSTRRQFIDRFVYAKDPLHLSRVTKYETATRERLHILKHQADPQNDWLSALERTMSEEGLKIFSARKALLDDLSSASNVHAQTSLPCFQAFMQGSFETFLQDYSSSDWEAAFKECLAQNRFKDREAGQTKIGPHKSDLFMMHSVKNQEARLCSTGEQKILILSLYYAFMKLYALTPDKTTVFLLDDVIAHLDETYQRALFQGLIFESSPQLNVFFTGTDPKFFDPIKSMASFIHI